MSPRKRIGVMIPSTNTTCEADFQMTVPRDVTIHGQRLWMTNEGTGDDAYKRMNGEIETGARYLATAKVDVIAAKVGNLLSLDDRNTVRGCCGLVNSLDLACAVSFYGRKVGKLR